MDQSHFSFTEIDSGPIFYPVVAGVWRDTSRKVEADPMRGASARLSVAGFGAILSIETALT